MLISFSRVNSLTVFILRMYMRIGLVVRSILDFTLESICAAVSVVFSFAVFLVSIRLSVFGVFFII